MSGGDHTTTYIYITFLFVLIVFVIVGGWMESKHLPFGHETGFIILFGMLISVILSNLEHDEYEGIAVQFQSHYFFDFFLPAILFAAGYNMRRKEFFDNFVNIIKFGIFGSLFTWVIFVTLTYLLINYVEVEVWDPELNNGDGGTRILHLTTIEIMLICSIFVSSDIIAAMSIIKFEEQPHIFSMIIGEGLFNDVVVLVLYATC